MASLAGPCDVIARAQARDIGELARPLVTHARISLGSASGTGIQVRAGLAPIRASLPPIARTVHAVWLRLTTPAHGRYRRV